jgi:D-glycero-alpha-D-manno-heptose-7-phosphate kinase
MTNTNARSIDSIAPTRVDLAGGTVDIWPIYLFLKKPVTLNLGINLFAETRVDEYTPSTPSERGMVHLQSQDQGAQLSFKWNQMDEINAPPALILHHRLLKLFTERKTEAGMHNLDSCLRLTTHAKSPAGAGLGGSSALSVSMIGGLASWAGSSVDQETQLDPAQEGERWIDIVRDVETTVIQVPAGLQDYYGAMYGGLQSLKWRPGRHIRESFSLEIMRELEDRLLLFYSGQSRNSGINNWALFKSFIDKDGKVRGQFDAIAEATLKLQEALLSRNWDMASQAIGEEWNVRRGIAPGISTPEMDFAFSIAKNLGAPSGKVCGAGGGGCFFVFVPSGDPALKAEITQQICSQGIRHLPFKASEKGLSVKVTRGA